MDSFPIGSKRPQIFDLAKWKRGGIVARNGECTMLGQLNRNAQRPGLCELHANPLFCTLRRGHGDEFGEFAPVASYD